MLNGKYVSLNTIIGDVYRDIGATSELPWEDMIVWAFEALQLIGSNQVYVPKFNCVDMQDYRIELPCDFHQLRGVSVDGYIPVRSGDTFHELIDKESCKFIDGNSNSNLSVSSGYYIDNFGNEAHSNPGTNGLARETTFSLNNNYITFNVSSGKVCLSYWAVHTDEDGFPLIPENVRVQKAVKAYLVYKLHYIDFIKGNIPGAVFKYSEGEWLWYVGSAHNAIKTPDLAMSETIRNNLQRLIPKQYLYQDRYATYLREQKYIH